MNIPSVPPLAKRNDDFALLQSTIQAGNLSAAQGAFAAFQQDVQKTATTAGSSSMFSPGTQASKDLAALGVTLKSSNVAGAQKAFGALVQDIQSAGGASVNKPAAPRGHHPLTAAEVANNGVAVPSLSAPSADALRKILGSKV